MKIGLQDSLRQRVHRLNQDCHLQVEALVRNREDVRARRDEWELGTKTNVTLRDDGSVQITGTSAAKMQSTSSNGFITDLDNNKPLDVFAYELDESIGPNPYLTKVQLWLDRKNNGGQPVFDGFFKLTIYRVHSYVGLLSAIDAWRVQQVGDPVIVNAASMSADQALVDFDFTTNPDYPGTFVPGVLVDGKFRPQYGGNRSVGNFPGIIITREDPLNGRLIIAVVTAYGGSNTNYGLGRDSGLANKITTGGQGTLRHYVASNPLYTDQLGAPNPYTWKMSGGTGMIRGGFLLGSYGPSATGSLALTGAQKPDLGASVSGAVEFICRGNPPTGTSIVFQARVNGVDPWVTVKDGQSPADVGLAVSQSYEMQALLTANAAGDVTPTLWAMGILDRVLFDLTEIATLEGFSESVDILTGKVKMAEVTCWLEHTGKKDFQDIATRLFSDYDFVQVEIRCYAAHLDLPRDQWLPLHIWRVDDYEDTPTRVRVTLVSVLERLRGRFPAGSGTLFGWMLKQANSDLTGGADFTKEISESIELPAGSIAFNIASSATEDQLCFTKAGVPNLQKWPTGNWSVQVNVTVANTNLQLSVAIARVNAQGTQQEISRFTPEQQATSGVKVFQLQNLAWATGALGDRIKVVLRVRNTVASTQGMTIETGTTNTQVQAPWFPTQAQDPKRYDLQTIQAVYQDWIAVQVGLAEIYRGRIPADATTKISKSVMDADGKEELERIAWAGRGIVIGSQGLVHYVPCFEPRQIAVAHFPLQEITMLSASPGLRARVPVLFCGYGYDTTKKEDFAGEIKVQHAAALAKFGVSKIDNPTQKIDEEIAKWFPDQGVALLAAAPFVLSLATGYISWRFRSEVPHPELDLGDCVLVETESFTMRDPNTGEAIRGFTVGLGIITAIEGVWGDTFEVYIRSPADLFSINALTVRRRPFEAAYVNPIIQPVVGEPQNALVTLQSFPPSTKVYYYVHPDTPFPITAAMLSQSGLTVFTAANCVDGDLSGAAWGTDSASSGATLQVDLGAGNDQAFTRVQVYTIPGSYVGTYDIEYSDNGSSWIAAATAFTPSQANLNAKTWAHVGAHRYWRLRLTNTPGAGSELAELQFFTNSGGAYTAPPERDNPLWLLYTGPFKVARSAFDDALVSCYASYQGSISPVFTARVPKDNRPQVLTITMDADQLGAMSAVVQADGDTGSIKLVGRKTGFPSLADVQATTAIDGRNTGSVNVIDAATGSQMVIDPNAGEACYVTAVAYSRSASETAAGRTVEGPIAQARFKISLKKRQSIFQAGGNFTAPGDWNNSNNSVEGMGGGAGGGAGVTNTRSAGGGGGAAYAKKNNVTLTLGATYPFTVGGGGAAGTSSGQNGSNGGSTTFNTSTMVAPGGTANSGITGGAGGGTGTGDVTHTGGTATNGANGSIQSGGSGGGCAGTTTNGSGSSPGSGGLGGFSPGAGGGPGTPPTPVNAQPGAYIGGGGGGGACTATAFSQGGAGAAGIIVITWYS